MSGISEFLEINLLYRKSGLDGFARKHRITITATEGKNGGDYEREQTDGAKDGEEEASTRR